MNATIRMWANRWSRMRGAWIDPENRRTREKPWITHNKGWWTSNLLVIGLLIYWVNHLMTAEYLVGMWEMIKFLIAICVIHFITWWLVQPSAEWYDDEDDNTNGFWISSIMGCLVCGFVLTATINNIEDRPVTQQVYDSIKAGDPDCTRYNAYRVDRIERSMILYIKDLRQAAKECKATAEKVRILNKQKALK